MSVPRHLPTISVKAIKWVRPMELQKSHSSASSETLTRWPCSLWPWPCFWSRAFVKMELQERLNWFQRSRTMGPELLTQKISGHSHQCRFIDVCVVFSSSMVFAIAIFQCPCQFRNLGSTLGFHFGKLSDSTPPPPGPKMALPWDVRRFLASSFLGWIWIVWMLSYFFHSFADKNACNPNNLIWIRKRIMIMVLLKDDHSGVKSDYDDYATCRQKILWGSERDSLLRHAVSAS